MSSFEDYAESTLSDYKDDLRTRFEVRTFTINDVVTYL
jgi:hypothetical protein